MLIADLHIHSKYSMATSRDCVPEALDLWARRKGIGLVGTGDFTHPAWRQELADKLEPAEEGLYRLKGRATGPSFVITGEISSIYKKDGKTRKVHNLILLPSLEAADLLAKRLETIGNIHSDGRPILGLDSRDLLEITLEACPQAIFVPAHIWTPHFSVFGAFSGFNTMEECFGDLTPYIHAVETGLSADPPMIWRLSGLDGYQLISNSDAHSPSKLGREANLLEIEPSYPALAKALQTGAGLKGTIEFFPEEGKYHLDGHRPCRQRLTPAQTQAADGRCPICGKKITVGVLHRVEELADRPEGYVKPGAAAFESLVPLPEVIAAANGGGAAGKKTVALYETMLQKLGPEFYILRECPVEDVERVAGPCVAEGLRRLRAGRVERIPGYDGVYGSIGLLTPAEREALNGQCSLFGATPPKAAKKREGLRKKPGLTRSAEQGVPAWQPDPEQRAAIAAPEAAVAVLAGPGTGKTATLVARIAHLVEDQNVKPKDITAVTFTNKAAEELRSRLTGRLGKRAAAMTVGTFHAVCQALLETRAAGQYETWELAAQVLKELGGQATPDQLLRAVSRAKNGFGPQSSGVPQEAVETYIHRLRSMELRDFDDLLLDALALDHTVPHLLVDEFQDVDPVQYRLVLSWSRKGKTLYTIGDPDQAIYGFRGAQPQVFRQLAEDLPHLRTYVLTRNYRSTPEILSCAKALLPQSGTWEATCSSGPAVRLLTAETPMAQAVFVAKEIGRMVGGMDMLEAENLRGRSFSDIAVLYRTRRQAKVLEECLTHDGIPWVAAGREDLLTDPAVRGLLCLCRLALDPGDPAAAAGCGLVLPEGTALPELLEKLPAKTAGRPDRFLEELLARLDLPRGEGIDRLIHMAVLYPDLEAFLQAMTIGQEADLLRCAGLDYPSGAVRLMTFHAAKGLEFPAVFLCGLDQGIVPLATGGETGDESEERRLLYVAMTRAREELILLAGPRPSPFLNSLPQAVERAPAAPGRARPKAVQLSFF